MKRAQRGFTLLEMIAALVLFAIAGSVLLVAYGQSARSLLQVHASDRLSLAARSLVDEQRDTYLKPGTREGTMGQTIAWRMQISQAPGRAGGPPLFKIDLRLRERGRELSLSTLVVQSPRPGARP